MTATADTTTIAMALGMARSLARQAKEARGMGRSPVVTLLAEQLQAFEDGLEALKRIEAQNDDAGRVPLLMSGKVVGMVDSEVATLMATGPGNFSMGFTSRG